jgi:hypothetical protein
VDEAHTTKELNLTQITLKFTAPELRILTDLVADQLFRREFIDCRLPGFKSNAPELNIGKQLVQRMRLAAGEQPARPETVAAASVVARGKQNS